MSTATERIMRERGDFACFHEPFLYDYYLNRSARMMTMLEGSPDRPRDYRGIRDWLIAKAEEGPVFFKDMSYYVVPHILEDEAFCRRLVNTFLIRDPVRSIPSYWKLDPGMISTEVGYVAQARHVTFLRERCGQSPVIIEAESISADPQRAMTVYWQAIGIAPNERALSWQPGVPEDWKPVAGWHGAATSSTGIRPQATQEEARAAFEQAAAQAPHLKDYLAEHLPAYRALKAAALAIG
jgi:hypothetical protein